MEVGGNQLLAVLDQPAKLRLAFFDASGVVTVDRTLGKSTVGFMLNLF